jgi:hypothetical protein
MPKQLKLILGLSAAALFLVVYLLVSSQEVAVDRTGPSKSPAQLAHNGEASAPPVVDPVVLENNYKSNVKSVMSEIDSLFMVKSGSEISEDELAEAPVAERLSELKFELMDLKVPEEYKDLHFSLVLSFSKIKHAVETSNEQAKIEGLSLLDDARKRYEWLVN